MSMRRTADAVEASHLRLRQSTVNLTWVFPALLLVLNLGAALVAFTGGDWRRGVYWVASAVCIGVVAFR